MSLFSKPKIIFWPKSQSVEVYFDKKENNTLSFDINFWKPLTDTDTQSLTWFFHQAKADTVSVLLPDDVVLTKSFIYDTKISEIDKKEVIGLAESFVHFKIDPESLEYNLVQTSEKTIIQARIFDKEKIDVLKSNLAKLNVAIDKLTPLSASIASVVSGFYSKEYYLIYPIGQNEHTLLLANGSSVYLTSVLKGSSLDIQKILNYSNLYFSAPVTKIFLPKTSSVEVLSNTVLDKTEYDDSQIAQSYNKSSNLPLPVVGALAGSSNAPLDIIKSDTTINSVKPMENKKNVLPIVAVFIFTAALASIIIWFVLNRNAAEENASPISEEEANVTPIVEEVVPTEIPTPTVMAVDKAIKIQVLNATDINGQAATLKEKLSKLGFTSIAVGNSKDKATENAIRLKPSMAGAESYFKQQLAGEFDATFTTDLVDSGTYDAVFIIGTDLSKSSGTSLTGDETVSITPTKSASATPTKKPTATPTLTE